MMVDVKRSMAGESKFRSSGVRTMLRRHQVIAKILALDGGGIITLDDLDDSRSQPATVARW